SRPARPMAEMINRPNRSRYWKKRRTPWPLSSTPPPFCTSLRTPITIRAITAIGRRSPMAPISSPAFLALATEVQRPRLTDQGPAVALALEFEALVLAPFVGVERALPTGVGDLHLDRGSGAIDLDSTQHHPGRVRGDDTTE